MKSENSNYESILHYYNSLIDKSIDEYAFKRYRLRLPIIPETILLHLFKDVQNLFENEELILNLNGNFLIIGDLNGNIIDFFRIYRNFRNDKDLKYIFLGNIIGENDFSIEIITLIYILKVLYPTNFYLIRGSNEFIDISLKFKFVRDLTEIYKTDIIFSNLISTFSYLPIAAILNKNYFCLHAGIGPTFKTLDDIKLIKRPFLRHDNDSLNLFWSNPTDSLPLFLPTNQGILFGSQALNDFLNKNHFKQLFRSHQHILDGIHKSLNQKLITICSSSLVTDSNYKSGIYLIINNNEESLLFEGYQPLKRSEVVFLHSQNENHFNINPLISSIGSQKNISNLKINLTPPIPNLDQYKTSQTATNFYEKKNSIALISRRSSIKPIIPKVHNKQRKSDLSQLPSLY